jgi:hypothetical protein
MSDVKLEVHDSYIKTTSEIESPIDELNRLRTENIRLRQNLSTPREKTITIKMVGMDINSEFINFNDAIEVVITLETVAKSVRNDLEKKMQGRILDPNSFRVQ